MNKIEAREIISYNQKISAIYIDNIPIDKFIYDITGNISYDNLWCYHDY